MRLYIAGPMTGYEDYNFPAFNLIAQALARSGYEVYNPASSFNGRQDLPYDIYLRQAIQMVTLCDGVVLLDGWMHSKGALTEAHAALSCGLDLYIFYDNELVKQSFTHESLARAIYWHYIGKRDVPREPDAYIYLPEGVKVG